MSAIALNSCPQNAEARVTMDLVNRYAAALSLHPTPVEAVGEVAGEILERFDGESPDLVVCFASPHHVGPFEDIAGGLRKLLEPQVMMGCTAVAVAGGGREVENAPGLSVFAASFAAGTVQGVALDATETSEGFQIVGWPDTVGARGTLLMLADPFSFPIPDFLGLCNARVSDLTVIGGLASSANGPGGNRLVLDDRITTRGAVGIMCSEDVPVRAVVSQGCRPIGQPFTVTKAERNLVHELAGQPAMKRLEELVAASGEDERELMRQGLHVGVVVDEHRLDFRRGDFLVRNLLGADQKTGALAIGETVGIGQTVQFHVRDASAADEDLRAPARRGLGRRRTAVHVQRPRHATVSGARSRHRPRRGVARSDPPRRLVLRGRDRSRRRQELPPRLHRQPRVVRALILGELPAGSQRQRVKWRRGPPRSDLMTDTDLTTVPDRSDRPGLTARSLSRRHALGWIGAAGLAAFAAACGSSSDTKSAGTSSTSPTSPTSGASGAGTTNAAATGACALTPELTEGPYYIADEAVRRDITEGKAGVPLELGLTVVDATTCTPIPGATVEVWHADAAGDYSGFGSATSNRTFLRGSKTPAPMAWSRSRRCTRAGTRGARLTSI